jgi:hypothetical protein
MTTFTTEDRIIAEKDGSFTVNVEPIPFAGMVNLNEPDKQTEVKITSPDDLQK